MRHSPPSGLPDPGARDLRSQRLSLHHSTAPRIRTAAVERRGCWEETCPAAGRIEPVELNR